MPFFFVDFHFFLLNKTKQNVRHWQIDSIKMWIPFVTKHFTNEHTQKILLQFVRNHPEQPIPSANSSVFISCFLHSVKTIITGFWMNTLQTDWLFQFANSICFYISIKIIHRMNRKNNHIFLDDYHSCGRNIVFYFQRMFVENINSNKSTHFEWDVISFTTLFMCFLLTPPQK